VDKDLLVIGYGNTLRSDDGVGPKAAAAFGKLHLPGVVAIACPQLTPELADPLSRAGAAVFVDAAVGQPSRVRLLRLDPAISSQVLAHTAHPSVLLALARDAFGRAPDAWMLTIPADQLGFGEQLSPRAARGVRKALLALRALHRELRWSGVIRAQGKAAARCGLLPQVQVRA
jgi:hydrogenase maturation protease